MSILTPFIVGMCWTDCPCPTLVCRTADSHASYLPFSYLSCIYISPLITFTCPCLISAPLSTAESAGLRQILAQNSGGVQRSPPDHVGECKFLNFRRMPRTLLWDSAPSTECLAVREFALQKKLALMTAHNCILAARVKQTRGTNQKR
jgi:hypothetical protein